MTIKPFHDLHKAVKVVISVAAIITALGVIGSAVAWAGDQRYALKSEQQLLLEQSELTRWGEQVELVDLKEASGVPLTSDDKIRRSYYKTKIDNYNHLINARIITQ